MANGYARYTVRNQVISVIVIQFMFSKYSISIGLQMLIWIEL